jgi:hypothetical protein
MKKVLVTIALAVASFTATAQNEFTTIEANGYQFNYKDNIIFWGKETTATDDLSMVNIKNKNVIKTSDSYVEYFLGTYGMAFFFDKANNTATVLYPTGESFTFKN